MWILTRSDTNQAAQPLEMARGLKFWIKEVEGLYYPFSENKSADQLRGYREGDLRLCFCICKSLVFSRRGSNYKHLNSEFVYVCLKMAEVQSNLSEAAEVQSNLSEAAIQK